MNKVTIGPADVGDAQAILDLQRQAYQSEAAIYDDDAIPPLTQTLAEMEADFESQVFLKAAIADTIVGSVRAYLKDRTCHIGRLVVHPDFQNQGIGTGLLNEIEQVFEEAVRFELFTGDKSERNLHLYRKSGYRPHRTETISDALTIVLLEKQAHSP